MNDAELEWKSYEKDVELYKFYLDIVLKVAVFVFGITGAIVSYYIANLTSQPWARMTLMLPLIMNVAFGFIYWRGLKPAQSLAKGNLERSKRLGIGRSLDMESLPWVLKTFISLYVLVSIGLLFLMFVTTKVIV